jgi:hypothetical protein
MDQGRAMLLLEASTAAYHAAVQDAAATKERHDRVRLIPDRM